MNWKKTLALSLAALAVAGAISGCGGDKKDAKAPAEKKKITVGITPGYSEKVMEFVAQEAEKQGLKVNIKSFSDYVTPDQALAAGDIDLNSFQHGPFLEAFNEKNGTKLVSIGNTYLAPLRIYSNKITDIKDVPDGAKVSIPNDPSNGGRALLLLDHQGLLKLKEGTDPTKAVVGDIAEIRRACRLWSWKQPSCLAPWMMCPFPSLMQAMRNPPASIPRKPWPPKIIHLPM